MTNQVQTPRPISELYPSVIVLGVFPPTDDNDEIIIESGWVWNNRWYPTSRVADRYGIELPVGFLLMPVMEVPNGPNP